MATANHEVTPCECGHGKHLHDQLKTAGMYGGCQACSCPQFKAKPVNLKEGEHLRRLTED